MLGALPRPLLPFNFNIMFFGTGIFACMVYLNTMYMSGVRGRQKGFPRTGVTDGCELPGSSEGGANALN